MEKTAYWAWRIGCASVRQGAPLRIRIDMPRLTAQGWPYAIEGTYPPRVAAYIFYCLRHMPRATADSRNGLRVTLYEGGEAYEYGIFDGGNPTSGNLTGGLVFYYRRLRRTVERKLRRLKDNEGGAHIFGNLLNISHKGNTKKNRPQTRQRPTL